MVSSKTEICNLSQDLLSGEIVTNIEDPTSALESLLARWYDHSRRQCLREHPWKFAMKRAIISKSATAPEFGYSAAFPVPSDFIRIISVESSNGYLITPSEYHVENHNGQLSILISTEASALNLRYIYDIQDVSSFDDLFVSYLALTLALSTAYKVTESNTVIERVANLQKEQGRLARSISGQERPPTRIERSKNISARRGGSNYANHILNYN